MRVGLRLRDVGTVGFTWADLRDFVLRSPPDSAVARAVQGDTAGWGISEHLLALVADTLRLQTWMLSGGDSPQPPPLPRPGVEPAPTDNNALAVDADELDRLLALPRK